MPAHLFNGEPVDLAPVGDPQSDGVAVPPGSAVAQMVAVRVGGGGDGLGRAELVQQALGFPGREGGKERGRQWREGEREEEMTGRQTDAKRTAQPMNRIHIIFTFLSNFMAWQDAQHRIVV